MMTMTKESRTVRGNRRCAMFAAARWRRGTICGAWVLVTLGAIGGCARYRSGRLECGAAAPAVDRRDAAGEARLAPGCTVRILTRSGELLEGRYKGADADSLWLDGGGSAEPASSQEMGWPQVDVLAGARKIACQDVVDIRVRERNTAGSVTVGVLTGLVLLLVAYGQMLGRGLSY
ncbi:MAG: hypothetical protein ACYDIE_11200 [Candidatus Krumholzibacteriia bacterium]